MTSNNRTNLSDHSIHTRKADPSEVAYRDGYTTGRTVENDLQYQNQRYLDSRQREDSNAISGLIIGMIFTALVGATAGVVYFANRDNTPPTTVKPSPSAQPQVQKTIIERTIDRTQEVVPVAPPNIQIDPPNVQITVPSPAAPAPVSQPPQSNSQPTTSTGQGNSAPQPSSASQGSGSTSSQSPTQP